MCLCGGRGGGICRGTDCACLNGRMGYCVSVCGQGETWCVCGGGGWALCVFVGAGRETWVHECVCGYCDV